MASGGHDNEADACSDDETETRATSGRGSPPPNFHVENVNICTDGIGHAQVVTDQMSVNNIFFNSFASQPRQRTPSSNDQALWQLHDPTDLSRFFKSEDLERKLEEKFLSYVANCCKENEDWRRLARKLRLDVPTTDRLRYDYGDTLHEFIFQLLNTWRKRHRGQLTVQDLVRILSESKYEQPAKELSLYFSSIY